MADDTRLAAVEQVARALMVKGASDRYHDEQVRRLRREWPVLATALDRLLTVHGYPPGQV